MNPNLAEIGALPVERLGTLTDTDCIVLLGYSDLQDEGIEEDHLNSTHRRMGAVRGLWMAMNTEQPVTTPPGTISVAESDRRIKELRDRLAYETVRAGLDSGIEASHIVTSLEDAGLDFPGTDGQRVTVTMTATFEVPFRESDGQPDDLASMQDHLEEHPGNACVLVSGRDKSQVTLRLDNCWGPATRQLTAADVSWDVTEVEQGRILAPEFADYLMRGMNDED